LTRDNSQGRRDVLLKKALNVIHTCNLHHEARFRISRALIERIASRGYGCKYMKESSKAVARQNSVRPRNQHEQMIGANVAGAIYGRDGQFPATVVRTIPTAPCWFFPVLPLRPEHRFGAWKWFLAARLQMPNSILARDRSKVAPNRRGLSRSAKGQTAQ
jgi:hypothetical protein